MHTYIPNYPGVWRQDTINTPVTKTCKKTFVNVYNQTTKALVQFYSG